ncbi:hypothetical protein LTR78_009393 [Recurvomyces mirabilis]|uniref:Heterokaryon incompatibility domain-containing protein n=1 Tax=Recurvomyces mirabilis TaxID=574656 RepID=A0AAE0WFD7_9PEZI|nr:hypothetical protein LTR78_009393 [Recurvomyces mirabilis]
MTDAYRQHEPEFRDDILTLKDEFSIAIANEPQTIQRVLLDDEIAAVLATGDWQHIPISEDTKRHRERMLFTYGSKPAVEPYNEITTLEFIEKPDPNLVLPIFRLYDLTKDSIDEYGDESKATYIALSHVWNQSTDAALRKACDRAHAVTGHTRFWVDRWCIKQTSIEDKAFHVPRMRDYYMHAAAVLVIAPDLAVLPDATNGEAFVKACGVHAGSHESGLSRKL